MTVDHRARFNELIKVIESDIPGFNIQFKTDSGVHQIIARLMFWINTTDPETGDTHYPYLETFTTVFGATVWYPSPEYIEKNLPWQVLEHEWVHLKDSQTFFGWLPRALSPINRALYSLIYILPPILSPGRAYIEIRGYRRSLELVSDEDREETLEHIIKQFTGASYLWMWPFPGQVRKMLEKPSPYRELMDDYPSHPPVQEQS